MAETERADQQPRHDLVAHAQHQGGIKRVMRQCDRGGHCNHIPREQRQLHSGAALGDTVAHRRHAAGHLRAAAHVARRHADQRGVVLHRLMRAQHVVVGRHNAQIAALAVAQRRLVIAAGGKSMRLIAAGQFVAIRTGLTCRIHACQIVVAQYPAAFGDAGGDTFNDRMQRNGGHSRAPVDMDGGSGIAVQQRRDGIAAVRLLLRFTQHAALVCTGDN